MRRFENNMYDSYTYVRTALNGKKNLLPEKDIDEINRMSEDGGDEDLGLYIKFSATGTQAVGIKSIDYNTLDYSDIQNPVANLEYSLDGKNWITWETGDPVEFGGGVDLYVRGMNPDGFSKVDISEGTGRFNKVIFEYDEPTSLSGNIMSLINYETRVTEIPNGACFGGMFYYCTSLISAPELPATELTIGCYHQMFSNCYSLTEAPELPATTLARNCYQTMFAGCSSLTTAPELPATELAEWCYCDMFDGCTSLTEAPELPATELAEYCYNGMFSDCTSLNLPANYTLPAEQGEEYCYSGMFSECVNIDKPITINLTSYTSPVSVNSCVNFMLFGIPYYSDNKDSILLPNVDEERDTFIDKLLFGED